MSFDGDSGMAMVYARKAGVGSLGAVDDFQGGAAMEDHRHYFIIGGLAPGVPHYVRVLAYNKIGYSQPAIARPLGTNDEIQAVVVAVAAGKMRAGILNGTRSAHFTLTHTDPNTGGSLLECF